MAGVPGLMRRLFWRRRYCRCVVNYCSLDFVVK